MVLSSQIVEAKVRYDEQCMSGTQLKSPCDVKIVVPSVMQGPVFLYYELENFYQNHRRYLKSRDDDQLNGKIKTVDELSSCDPVTRNKDVKAVLPAIDGTTILPADGPANPCGLVAKSFFNGKES